jgi:hypothetical protein
VLVLDPAVHLVLHGGEDVEAERLAAAEVADGVGARGDRLRLGRLEQLLAHAPDLARHDAEQVRLHVHQVDRGDTTRTRIPAPERCRGRGGRRWSACPPAAAAREEGLPEL